ncbi:NERD domain-containing protein [Nocardia sp. NPDC003693]
MLVRVQNPPQTHAEKTLIDWLRTWKGGNDPHGVATVNCSLFHGDRLYPFDAVIWTPTSCVVIEAEALVEKLDGELEVPLNGPWRVAEKLITFEGGDKRTPLDKSRDHTFALQNWFAERGLGQRVVNGAVLVVPPPGSGVRVQQLWSDPSFQVLVGDDPATLHEYFTALSSRGRPQWSANDVAWAFRGLGILPYLPAPQDLINEGFLGPVDITLWHGGPQQAQAEAYAEEQARLEREVDEGHRFTVPSPWFSPSKLYPREAGELSAGRGVMRFLLLLGMIIAVLWFVYFILAAAVQYGPL